MCEIELKGEFVESLVALGEAGEGLAAALCTGAASVAVRVHAGKGACAPAGSEPVAWCAEGFYLDERPLFAADPAWHQGRYYVQDASSMSVGAAAGRLARELLGDVPLRVLDACAAPGGKTIGLADAMPARSLLVANEYDARRAAVLAENVTKYGSPYIAVSRGSAESYGAVGEAFDVIVADMPCSGEGMMRKDATARSQWSAQLVAQCAATQRRIASALWKALKPGGLFVYSTCTFNRAENEDNVDRLAAETGAESVDPGLAGTGGIIAGLSGLHSCRFHPGRVRGEGQFVAVLRKPGLWRGSRGMNVRRKSEYDALAAAWLREAERFVIAADKNKTLSAVPAAHYNFLQELRRYTHFMSTGTELAVPKGRDMQPAHALALSTELRPDAFGLDELGAGDALRYLSGNSTAAPALAKGYYAPAYVGLPLGWAKNVGTRSNNLLPAALRLRTAIGAPVTNIIELKAKTR